MRADDGEIKKVKYVLVPYFFYKNLYSFSILIWINSIPEL